MQLTIEEQLVRDLAVEHYATLKVNHIVSHTISGSEQAQTYMVIGEAEETCKDCGGSHSTSKVLMFLRIGDGFSLLEEKRSTCPHEIDNGIPPLFKILFGLE